MHFSAVPPHRAGQVLASEWGTCFRCWGGVSPPVPSLALAILVQVLLALLVLLQDHHHPGPEAQAKLLNNSIQLLAVLAILLAPTLLAPHLERHRIHVCLIGFRRRYHPLRPFPRPALTNNCSLCPLLTPPCSGGPFTTPLEAPPGAARRCQACQEPCESPLGPCGHALCQEGPHPARHPCRVRGRRGRRGDGVEGGSRAASSERDATTKCLIMHDQPLPPPQ